MSINFSEAFFKDFTYFLGTTIKGKPLRGCFRKLQYTDYTKEHIFPRKIALPTAFKFENTILKSTLRGALFSWRESLFTST